MRRLLILICLLPIFVGCSIHAETPVTSQAPIPAYYRLTTQRQMQAAEHWMLLARDVAEQVHAKTQNYNICEASKTIYVSPSGATVFKKALHDLLITEFVKLGICVSNNEHADLVLNYDLQVIEHTRRIIKTRQGVFKSLAPGFYVKRDTPLSGPSRYHRTYYHNRHEYRSHPEYYNNYYWESPEHEVKSAELYTEAGAYTLELPKNEILFTVSLLDGNRYIFRHSSSYYINDLESWHYRIDSAQPNSSIDSAQPNSSTKIYHIVNQ
ncbi:hypothetical protein [Desulfosarcina ovata]|uniref:Lipoprotein n=1 Tax=Desulfosarcina ovata subsp. ovata TaxID=2752305 RepID=A0A5K8ALZ2_9BACT|nr:hypothetical protein [Desulfosarcina ovata]BBO92644.1 hypothetical protein DSCOOX_58240 [Desulfosarcina ovata subsp. ovata]